MPIFRRKNCIHAASGIVALCKRLHSTPVESRLLLTGVVTEIEIGGETVQEIKKGQVAFHMRYI
jgi:hypothetical protein